MERQHRARQLQALAERDKGTTLPEPGATRDARKLSPRQWQALLARYGFSHGVIGE